MIGASGIGIAWAKAKPPAYMVVEYEITDHAGFEEFIKGDAAIHGPRTFLARHAKGVSLSGEPPKWIGIFQFPSVRKRSNLTHRLNLPHSSRSETSQRSGVLL